MTKTRCMVLGTTLAVLLAASTGMLSCVSQPSSITTPCLRTCPVEPYATTAGNILISEGTQISAKVGQKFTITLVSNQTTGYQWQLAEPLDETMVKLVGSEYKAPQSGLVGRGGQEIWTFDPVRQGITQISLKYVRPWEKDVPTADERLYSVTIK